MPSNRELRNLGLLTLVGVGLAYLVEQAAAPPVPPQPQRAGLPTHWLDFVAAAQQEEMWCWAASIEMILKRYGVPTTQPQIVTNAYRAPLNLPGTDEAISSNLNGWAITVDRRRVIVRSFVVPGLPDAEVLIKELRQRRPILFALNTGTIVGHAVVVTGVEYVVNFFGLHVTSLTYRDPDPTPENVANRGRVQLVGHELSQFLSSVRSHWIVSVD